MDIIEKSRQKFIQYLNEIAGNDVRATEYLGCFDEAVELCQIRFAQHGACSGHFTSHGPDHSARVLLHALAILKQCTTMYEQPPGVRELLCLGVAAYIHDLGMTAPLTNEQLATCHTEHDKWIVRRRTHAQATLSLLERECSGQITVLRRNEEVLADIFLPQVCLAHSGDNLHATIAVLRRSARLDPETKYVRAAAILRLADELDIIRERAPQNFGVYNEFCSLSKAHWWRHWVVGNCYPDWNVIRIVHVPEGTNPAVKPCVEWCMSKIENQIKLLAQVIEPDGLGMLSSMTIRAEATDPTDMRAIPVKMDAEVLREIERECEKERARSPDFQGKSLITCAPALIDMGRISHPNAQGDASQAYRKVVFPYLDILKGLGGTLVTPTAAEDTYVWEQANKNLCDMLVEDIVRLLRERIVLPESPVGGQPHAIGDTPRIVQSRRIRSVTGEIGVGKSHFLRMLLRTLELQHPDLCSRALMVRAECMDANTVLDVKKSIVRELRRTLEVGNRIECINRCMAHSRQEHLIYPRENEIEGLSDDTCNLLVRTIAVLTSRTDSAEVFGTNGPAALCLFLDNFDHLREDVVQGISEWCHRLAADVAYILLFYRPETYDREHARIFKIKGHVSADRPAGGVVAPDPGELLQKRIAYLFKGLPPHRAIEINDVGACAPFTVSDAKQCMAHVATNLVCEKQRLLPSLAGEDMRILLDAFRRIIGSWAVDSYTFVRWKYLAPQAEWSIAGWPRLLEGLILGHRKWYKPEYSPVENIFAPPDVVRDGDYLVALHMLQIMDAARGTMDMELLCDKARVLGYRGPRVEEIVDWLSTTTIDREPKNDGVSYIPLIRCYTPSGSRARLKQCPVQGDMKVILTEWGRYHLHTLIYQLKYWKHIIYSMPLPKEASDEIYGENEEIIDRHLAHNVSVTLGCLGGIEGAWFRTGGYDDIRPVIESVRTALVQQLEGRRPGAAPGRETSLHFASSQNNPALVDLILRDSPHLVWARDENGRLPIDIARVRSDEWLIRKLLAVMKSKKRMKTEQ